MIKFNSTTIVILIACSISIAYGQSPGPHEKEESLKPVIENLISGLDGASVTLDSRGLEVAYRVQEFQVHTVFRDGKISEKARTERGPNKGGFLLRVVIQAEPNYTGPILLTPEGYGLIWHPYWETQVREIKLAESGEHVWITLAMGTSVDEELMHKLQEAIYTHVLAE